MDRYDIFEKFPDGSSVLTQFPKHVVTSWTPAKLGEPRMKSKLNVFATTILLLVSFSAYAATPRRPFFLRTTVTMNGAEVPAGIYELSWESQNSKVRVTLWKEGRFFAAAQGAWVKNGVQYPSDAALLRVNSDGSRSLMEIRLAGEKKSIVLGRN